MKDIIRLQRDINEAFNRYFSTQVDVNDAIPIIETEVKQEKETVSGGEWLTAPFHLSPGDNVFVQNPKDTNKYIQGVYVRRGRHLTKGEPTYGVLLCNVSTLRQFTRKELFLHNEIPQGSVIMKV